MTRVKNLQLGDRFYFPDNRDAYLVVHDGNYEPIIVLAHGGDYLVHLSDLHLPSEVYLANNGERYEEAKEKAHKPTFGHLAPCDTFVALNYHIFRNATLMKKIPFPNEVANAVVLHPGQSDWVTGQSLKMVDTDRVKPVHYFPKGFHVPN